MRARIVALVARQPYHRVRNWAEVLVTSAFALEVYAIIQLLS